MTQSSGRSHVSQSPIAIVGLGCRFPGGVTNPGEFWTLLRDGVDAIGEIPPDRWNKEALFSEDRAKPGKMYVRWGGFLDGIDLFDPEFFGISPREAVHVDPQQRLLLEVAYEALEHAGEPLAALRGSKTGVFVGLFIHDYAHMQLSSRELIDAYTGTGTSMSIAANRISYLFDLRGPSVALDTACSSSLVALHLACESLLHGECDAALAGGVNVILRPEMTVAMSKASMLSPDGRCHSFDAGANGYVRAEGAGVILLKRLDDALRDGNEIHAIIRSTASNQDGRTKGISVPNGEAQEALLREAQARAGIAPSEIQYVEAHGTGTPVGDPIEVNALGRVLREGRPAGQPCLIGSVKSNIGHTESASGVAGLLKVVLALKHGELPANLHFHTPNPQIDFQDLALEVVTSHRPWPDVPGPRLACLNSFGFGGTNAHAILQEGPRPAPQAPEVLEGDAAPTALLFPLSAHSKAALAANAQRLADYLETGAGAELPLSRVSYTLARRRSHHKERLGIVAADREELLEKLRMAAQEDDPAGVARGAAPGDGAAPLGFLFTGMGPQWWRMGRDLLGSEPIFRAAVEEVDALVRERAGWSVLEELLREEAASRIQETRIAQPCIFALQVGLFRLWSSWGIVPGVIAGHSVGEAAAAYAAGILSIEDAATVIVHRSRLQHRTEGTGTMLAVGVTEARARELVRGREEFVAVGAINSPSSVSLAGKREVLEDIERELTSEGIFARFLQVQVPYHSPGMDPLREELLSSLASITPRPARIPYYSTIRGTLVEGPELDAEYFWHNVRDTVVFHQAMERMIDAGVVDYVELGAHPALARSVLECLGTRRGSSLPSLRRNQDDRRTLLGTLGELYCKGHDPSGPHGARVEPPCELPSYPWQRQRYWDEPQESAARRLGSGASLQLAAEGEAHPLLGSRLSMVDQVFESQATELDYVDDHLVREAPVFPGAGYLEMSFAAAQRLRQRGDVCLRSVRFENALFWPKDETVRLQTVVRHGELEIHSRAQSDTSWTRHMSATLTPLDGRAFPRLDVDAVRARLPEQIPAEHVYPLFQDIGLVYGPAFQGITSVSRRRGEALADVVLPAEVADQQSDYLFHPALLDACLHTLFCTLGIDGEDADMRGDVYLPVRIERFVLRRPAGATLRSHCLLRERDGDRSFTGDVFIYDDDGELVALAEGLTCQNLTASDAPIPEKVRGWTYAYRWEEARFERTASDAERTGAATWVLLTDERGIAARLGELLTRAGDSAVFVRPGQHFEEAPDGSFRLDPGNPEHFRELVDRLGAHRALAGVVHLWGLDVVAGEETTTLELRASHARTYGSALHLVQTLGDHPTPARLWFVTAGAFPVVEDDTSLSPAQAPLWGLSRVIGNELPLFQPTIVDLSAEPVPSEVEQLARELASPSAEDEIALRGTRRYVHRFALRDDDATLLEPAAPPPNYALECVRKGSFDGLVFREAASPDLPPGGVEIEVESVGLNFKDVMKATGLLPQSAMENNFWGGALGMECSGRVLRVGRDVRDLTPGQEVVAFARHAFRRRLVTDARLVVVKPRGLSFDQAAALPLAFVTAHYALSELGRMQPGESVLIHAATGGVGQAAVRLAQRVGARILATAGSEEKRSLLRRAGIADAFDSRSLDFVGQVLDATGGKGVDLVLNSLAGDMIDRSLDVLADYGRFLELGKIDIDRNHRLGMRVLDRNASIHGVDLDRLLAQRPDHAGRLLREVMALFEDEELTPLPLRGFPAEEVSAAFQHMASAKHVGKVVISLSQPPAALERSVVPRFASDASYLITGGFGGFGRELLQWLAACGARHLVVLSRSGASTPEAHELVQELGRRGVQVHDERLDISSEAALAPLVARFGADLPPLRGVFHAAAILDDDLLKKQTLERYERVAVSKLEAAWALHRATRSAPLDHFVLFSSVTSVLGNHGSGNYVAANAFIDALAHYRRALGLPALTVNWGLIANVGMAQAEPTIRRHLEAGGLTALHTRLGLDALGRELALGTTQVTLSPLRWERWLKYHHKEDSPRFSLVAGTREETPRAGQGDAAFAEAWASASPADRPRLAKEAIGARVARIFGTSPSKLDPETLLSALGLDSLMALELRSKLEELGLSLPVATLLERTTLNSLTEALVASARPSSAPPPSPEGAEITESEPSTSVGTEPPAGATARPAAPTGTSRWIVTPEIKEQPQVRLICFPYAGGAPTAFHDWAQEVPEDFEVSAINLPGRGRRIGEAAYRDVSTMADEICRELLPLTDVPFAFYGHCMGAILMYEVAVRLRDRGHEPAHLFVGGAMAPHLYQSALLHEQPEPKFLDVLQLLDFTGTRALLEDDEMRRLLVPTLRADFEAVATYGRDFSRRAPLSCPITGFAAKRDLFAAPSSMTAWREYSTGPFALHLLDVHHYFVETHRTYLARTVAAAVAHDLGRSDVGRLRAGAAEFAHLARPMDVEARREPVYEHVDATPWFVDEPARGDASVRLYCFPAALGSDPGRRLLDSEVARHAAITRIAPPQEAHLALPQQARAIARALEASARPEPFAFFGHGLGALLAYEVARELAARGGRSPVHLFVTGAAAPHLYLAPNANLLGDDKLVDVLDVIGHPHVGDLRRSAALRRELLPRVRRDFERMADYSASRQIALRTPITVLRAKNDLWTFFYGMEAWADYTEGPFEIVTSASGDHFHVDKDPAWTAELVVRKLVGSPPLVPGKTAAAQGATLQAPPGK